MKEPYPIYLILKDRPVTVVGGGSVAERKIMSLLDTGARVTVVAPNVTYRIRSLVNKGRVRLKQRNIIDDDLEGQLLVFVATGSDEVNRRISRVARGKGILVNCADSPKECDFFVPSFFRRGSLTFAISTGGKTPALAKKIRRELQLCYGKVFAEYLDVLATARKSIVSRISLNPEQKKELMEKLLDSRLLFLLREGKKKEASLFLQDFLQQNLDGSKPKDDKK